MKAVIESTDEVRVEAPQPPSVPAAPAVVSLEQPSLVLERLLQMADTYHRNGAPKQALEMYFSLVDSHGQTYEGQQARARLMTVSAEYERQGMLRQARSIYERLL
jgi:hypothetical protein